MSSDASVVMRNIYCDAKYRDNAKRFSSIHVKNKILKVL